ncbi:hypothetical protein NEDG_00017 [Nematocida displodere]|uniref:Uncharacterized protein n=1 Tax=Nematocida displodere TaxID=1805483 RepID=A0A177EK95_9MICR|nr:hypothetical protein NEDG_00017 [Nematocida displodere]
MAIKELGPKEEWPLFQQPETEKVLHSFALARNTAQRFSIPEEFRTVVRQHYPQAASIVGETVLAGILLESRVLGHPELHLCTNTAIHHLGRGTKTDLGIQRLKREGWIFGALQDQAGSRAKCAQALGRKLLIGLREDIYSPGIPNIPNIPQNPKSPQNLQNPQNPYTFVRGNKPS